MVSLMSDARIVFLMWFISIAVLVAAALIFIEWKLNKKRLKEAEKKKEKTPIDKMKIFLKKDVELREKLDVIGKTAKDYFKERYGMSSKLSYGELVEEFKKKGEDIESEFCEGMFETYYFDHKLNKERIGMLAEMLETIYKKKETVKRVPKTLGLESGIERLDKFMGDVQNAVSGKVEEYVKSNEERVERAVRVARREEHELLSWVRRAIRMGYDKIGVSNLLGDAGQDKKTIKRALGVYDKETAKIMEEKEYESKAKAGKGKEGIAQKIIQNEKERLEANLV